MSFKELDDQSPHVDDDGRAALRQLRTEFGRVEYRQLENGEWCIRVRVHSVKEEESMPVATIGNSLASAMNRLIRVLSTWDR